MRDEAVVAVESPPKPKRRRKQPADAKPKIRPPYAVVVLNDDQHSFQYVIDTFMKVFGYTTYRKQAIARYGKPLSTGRE